MDLVDTSRGLKLLAQGVAVAAGLFWAAFFVDRLAGFAGSEGAPAGLWAAQLAHGVLIAGLFASLRWPAGGNLAALAAAAAFYLLAGGPFIPALFLLTIAPGLFLLLARVGRPRRPVHAG